MCGVYPNISSKVLREGEAIQLIFHVGWNVPQQFIILMQTGFIYNSSNRINTQTGAVQTGGVNLVDDGASRGRGK